jgi:hypothetical protein
MLMRRRPSQLAAGCIIRYRIRNMLGYSQCEMKDRDPLRLANRVLSVFDEFRAKKAMLAWVDTTASIESD